MSNTPCCTLQSVTLHHSASPPTQPIVLLRVRVLLIEATDFINASDNTIASLRLAFCRVLLLPLCRFRRHAL